MRRAKIGFIFQRFNLSPLSPPWATSRSPTTSPPSAPGKRELDKPLLDHLTEMLGIKDASITAPTNSPAASSSA